MKVWHLFIPLVVVSSIVYSMMCHESHRLCKEAIQRMDKNGLELHNEIDCLEWKYERDKVRNEGNFANRISNRRIHTWDGYKYEKPYETWEQVHAKRQNR